MEPGRAPETIVFFVRVHSAEKFTCSKDDFRIQQTLEIAKIFTAFGDANEKNLENSFLWGLAAA